MTLYRQLEGMLEKRVIRSETDGGNRVTLRQRSADMSVTVVGLSCPVAAIRMGGKARLDHLPCLQNGPGRKVCDYLLIARIDGADHAIFVELKKALTAKGDPEERLLRSRPLLDYLLAVCDIETGGKPPRPSVSYVLVYDEIRLNKAPVRPDPSGKIDEIPYKSISVKRFQGSELELADLV